VKSRREWMLRVQKEICIPAGQPTLYARGKVLIENYSTSIIGVFSSILLSNLTLLAF